MTRFDEILILDWSAAGRPKRGADAIWLGSDRQEPVNLPTRHQAFRVLLCRLFRARRAGRRVLLGVDVSFGFPAGFAARITGQATALSMWHHLSTHLRDGHDNANNYRQIAAAMNLTLGLPVFWGNTAGRDQSGLPRKKPPPHPTLASLRQTEILLNCPHARPKSVWQLAGAGAVGAQTLTALPRLAAIAARTNAAIWPFQPTDQAPVVMAEVYPSMIAPAVARIADFHPCRDAAQVHLLAASLRHLDDRARLAPLLTPDPRLTARQDEGQILAQGAEATLLTAAVAAASRPL